MGEQEQFGDRVRPLGQRRNGLALLHILPVPGLSAASFPLPDQGIRRHHHRFGRFSAGALRRPVVLHGVAGVLVPRHQRPDGRDDFLALIGERDEAGVEVDRADASALLADRLAHLFLGGDAVAQPDRTDEIDFRTGVVDRQIPGRNPSPIDRAGLAGNDAEGDAVEERRRCDDHAVTTRRRMRFVAPKRVVVADPVAEAADVVQVGFLARPVRQNGADPLAVFRLEVVDGLDQVEVCHGCPFPLRASLSIKSLLQRSGRRLRRRSLRWPRPTCPRLRRSATARTPGPALPAIWAA